jgi:gamma-glutamylcysteine synthetase
MEDFIQIILFALFALFSLVSNILNKRKKQQAETRKSRKEVEEEGRRPAPKGGRPDRRPEVSPLDEPDTRTLDPRRQKRQEQEKSSTFEEMLRELTGESPLEKRAGEAEEEDDYEHPFSERKARESAREAKQKMEKRADDFGKSVRKAKGARRISDKIDLEQDISSKRLKVKKAKSGRRSKSAAADIAQSLKNPQSARKAIILSEIINPKHF